MESKVYQKETRTYIYWTSNYSRNCKLGILKGLIHQAHLLCDRKEDLLEEIQLLKAVLIANGYPKNLVERTVKASWEIELEKEMKKFAEELKKAKLASYPPGGGDECGILSCLACAIATLRETAERIKTTPGWISL